MQLVGREGSIWTVPVTKTCRLQDGRRACTEITVRMLLNHSSGLPWATIANGFLLNDPDTLAADTLLEELSTQTLKADPGAFSVYCNDGFTLAELVVEAVSGRSFDVLRAPGILSPPGLQDTWFPGEDFDQSLPSGEDLLRGGRDPRSAPETVGSTGTGGIYATASDLAPSAERCSVRTGLSADAIAASMADEYARGIWPRTTRMWSPTDWAGTASTGTHLPTAAFRPWTKGGDTLLLPRRAGGHTRVRYGCGGPLSPAASAPITRWRPARCSSTPWPRRGVSGGSDPPRPSHRRGAAMPAELADYPGCTATPTPSGKVHRHRRRRPHHPPLTYPRPPLYYLQRRLLPGRDSWRA